MQQPRRLSVSDLWRAAGLAGTTTGCLQADLQALCDEMEQVNATLSVLTERAEKLAADLQRERTERQQAERIAVQARLSPLLPADAVSRHDRW